ncbi:hypothetical protein NQ317_019521 [Molorchus minor]|uniref:Integrase catalytic domain-containing protein n=1 Tax=Molorchus minor TaxID=1323400 RepID=A0ABQ9IR01_9CUCU|nr:hypothetical protein NQ317_019521 [Molorchus minor]
MSRLCKINEEPSFDKEGEHHIFTVVETSAPRAMHISQIISESQQDKQITEAVTKISHDSWETSDKNIYFPFKGELTNMGPVLLRGNRLIVVPETLRADILKLGHEGHPGETVMKRRLRAKANGEVENMNRAILKRLKICHVNKLNYQAELQKFIMMYNTTPHGTTGKSPSELLLNRNIRDKIPSISDLVNEPGDEEARDTDIIKKHIGKEKEDRVRNAKETEIKHGDKVLIRNMNIPHKLTTRFNNDEYTVIHKEGNEVTVSREDGQVLKRHVSHVKKIPEPIASQHACSTSSNLHTIPESPVNFNPNPIPSSDDTTSMDQEEPPVPEKLPPLKLKKNGGIVENAFLIYTRM